jgi:hypothetical protein
MGLERRGNMTALKKDDCKHQLRYQCKLIAEDITAGDEDAHKWCEGVYDIEWITFQDHSYKAARLMVAGGGPNIWVNTQTGTVDGYWGTDKVHWHYTDNIGLDDYLSELYHASK